MTRHLLALMALSSILGCNGVAPAEDPEGFTPIIRAPVPLPFLPTPTKWAVLLCKFSDVAAEPQPASYFRDMFTEQGAGKKGLYDYWAEQSYDQITLAGSTVYDWKQMPFSVAEEGRAFDDASISAGSTTLMSVKAKFHSSDVGKTVGVDGVPFRTTVVSVTNASTVVLKDAMPASRSNIAAWVSKEREQLTEDCIHTFEPTVDFSSFYGVVAIINAQLDSGSTGKPTLSLNGKPARQFGALVLDPYAWNDTFAAHEMGHGYGLSHSWSLGSYGSPDVEYGDWWDVMSAMRCATAPSPYFGDMGPSLNAAYRERMGWIGSDRIYTWGYTGTGGLVTEDVTLAAVNLASVPGPRVAHMKSGYATDGSYYTVEFHRRTGWDLGIPRDAVLIHKIKTDGLSYLVNGDYAAGDVFVDSTDNVHISVIAIDPTAGTATVNLRYDHGVGGGGGGGTPTGCWRDSYGKLHCNGTHLLQ